MMVEYLGIILRAMRPAFKRNATFLWFVVVFFGLAVRNDSFGVSSIVRALHLLPACYPCLLHFFHSAAWSAETLYLFWWRFLAATNAASSVNERIVLIGDHTKQPKDGRRMPQVETLHQDSETSSKPSFFRGHHWGCICLLLNVAKRCFATPLWAEIHRDSLGDTRATRLVTVAARILRTMGQKGYLVLDAFFAAGSVFQAAEQTSGLLHILTRGKSNTVAYRPPPNRKKKGRGRPRKYGRKLHLMKLFKTWADKFDTVEAEVYRKLEPVNYLTLNLLWKPTGGMLRFFLIKTSLGRIILITDDLNLSLPTALQLYCRRATIETMFNVLKNILGGMAYHFWSRYLEPASRRPIRNDVPKPISSHPEKTQNTLAAIEKFISVQLLLLGVLQLLALRFPKDVIAAARCWLRTPCIEIPSEFVTQMALTNTILSNKLSFVFSPITSFIRNKLNRAHNSEFQHLTY